MATVITFDLTVDLCMKESLCTFLTGDNGVNLACIHPALPPTPLAIGSCYCCYYDTQYHEVIFLGVILSLLNLFGCELQCF